MIVPDRRHDDHPCPPEGVGERRICSDPICVAAREDWFDKTLLPRLMNRLYVTMGAAVMALSGLFMYLASNAIRDFELKIKDEYESRSHHEEDIKRIERKFDNHSADVINRLDRNLDQIRAVQATISHK